MRNFTKFALLLFCLQSCLSSLSGQTTIIDPAAGGGFESGSDFAGNGWTVVNGSQTNKWFVGSVATPFGGSNSAYVSNNASGTTYNYLTTSASTVFFYKDIVFPSGETTISLTFKWKAYGETISSTLYDYLRVYLSDSGTPTTLTAGTIPSTGYVTLGSYNLVSTYQTATITITAAQAGNTSASSNRRVVFMWRNDSSSGTQPPASVDNISLTSQLPPAPSCASGFSPTTGTTGVNFLGRNLTWAATSTATGYRITFGSNSPNYDNIANNVDLGNVLTYATGTMTANTTYGWKIVPYNASGSATGCTFNTFTTSANLIMGNGNVTYCSGTFYDSGGSGSNYSNSENYTLTVCPSTSTDKVKAAFTAFSTEATYDFLYIYNGNSTAAPLIGSYTGSASPGSVTSTAANGCLTFNFTSDGSTTSAGWTATMTCEAPPACSPPSAPTVSNIGANTADLSWTAPSPPPATGYEWAVTTSSTPPTSGTAVSGTSASVSGLTGLTTYYLHVRSDCGGSGYSSWVSSTAFTTTMDCAAATSLSCSGSQTSGNLATTGGVYNITTCYSGGTPGKEKLYSFTPTLTGTYTLNITSINGGSGYIDYFYKAASGGCGSTGWTCILDRNATGTTTFGPLTAGTTYYLLLDAEASSGTINHTFQIDCPAAMTYVSSTVAQPVTTTLGAGSTGNQILRIDVVVIGNVNPISVTQLDFNTNGSTNAASDLSNAKVYYTSTSSTFATTTQYGTTVSAPNGTFNVTGTQALTGGLTNTTNYFWLVYDINCAATATNVVDAQCTSITAGSAYTPTVTDPAGSRTITALYAPAYTSVGTTTVTQGSTNNQIVRVNISGSSLCSGTATSITFNTSNSTNPAVDIKSAKCYYTTTTTFASTSAFGATVSNPSGDITFTGSQALAVGTGNYFWLVYDMDCLATASNTVNATAVSMIVQSSTITVTGTTPTAKSITALSSVATAASGNWSSAATWTGGCVPNGTTVGVTLAHDVAVDGSYLAGNVTVNASKILTVAGGSLTLGTSSVGGVTGGSNKILTVNGTLTVTGGTLEVNGGIQFTSTTSAFNMSGGTINIDPNDGTASSVAGGTSSGIMDIQTSSMNVSGGAINFLDPPYTSSNRIIAYNHASTDAVWGSGCIVTFGGGDDVNTSNSAGFYVECNVGTGTLEIGNLVVNSGRNNNGATNVYRHASTNNSSAYITKIRNLSINSGSEFVLRGAPLAITGNLVNDGYITCATTTSNRGLVFCGDAQYNSGIIFSNSSTGQSLSGSGYFKKATTDTDPITSSENVIGALGVFHTISSPGLTVSMPISILNLDLGSGTINTNISTLFTVGYGPTSITGGSIFTGGLSGTPVTPTTLDSWTGGWINGPLRRWFTGITSGQSAFFPIGKSTSIQQCGISYSTAPSTAGTLTAEFFNNAPNGGITLPAPITQGALSLSFLSPSGYWDVSASGTNAVSGGNYTSTFYANGFSKIDGSTAIAAADYPLLALLKRGSGSSDPGDWALNGSHVTTSNVGGAAKLSRTNMSGFSEFAVGGTSFALPLELQYFTGKILEHSNHLEWQTLTEYNVQAHVVERSDDGGVHWTEIGRKAGQLNSILPLKYDLEDLKPVGTAYYRLHSIDFDGKSSYSGIVLLTRPSEHLNVLSLYPSPATAQINLQFNTEDENQVWVRITDLTGKEIVFKQIETRKGLNEVAFDLNTLQEGLYMLNIGNDRETSAPVRFVKQ